MIKIKEVLARIAPNGKPTSSAKLLATIEDLERQRAEAQRLVAGADARANEMLMSDRDKDLDQLETDVREAQRTIDKIEVVLPGLRERLTTSQAYEKKAAIARHQAKLKSLVDEQERAVKACLDLNEAIVQVRTEAFRELGTNVAHMTITDCVYHGMLNPTGFEAWRDFVRSNVAAAPSEWPRPQLVVAPQPAPKPVPAKSVRSAAPMPDADGNIMIIVCEPGFRNGDSFAFFAAGQRVMASPGWAALWVESGRAEYATPATLRKASSAPPIYPGRPAPAVRPARPPLPAEVPEGFLRVTVLRGGYCDHEGRQCDRGIDIDLPEDVAGVAALSGAVEIKQCGSAAP